MILLCATLAVISCAETPRMTPSERLDFYRANSGDPVRSFRFTGTLWGWRSLGDSALAVWPRRNQGYLLELTGRCQDLAFATAISLSNRTGRVSAGFDSVTVLRGTSRAASRAGCNIRTIRPINTHVVKEVESELGEVEPIERDPSIPDEPPEG
jgi:hypothetical protein